MAQIFHPSFNMISKLTIFGGLFLLAGGLWVWGVFLFSPYSSKAGTVQDQPVPFSHRRHVTQLGLDCRYCHTSVEESSFAGLPPTETCMTCHSQIWTSSPVLAPVRESFRTGRSLAWTRVYDLPDFVYFDHSIHVKKGIGCNTCHGQIDEMPLTWEAYALDMEWCINCHRHPEQYIRPRSEVFNPRWQPEGDGIELGNRLVEEYHVEDAHALTNCDMCHR